MKSLYESITQSLYEEEYDDKYIYNQCVCFISWANVATEKWESVLKLNTETAVEDWKAFLKAFVDSKYQLFFDEDGEPSIIANSQFARYQLDMREYIDDLKLGSVPMKKSSGSSFYYFFDDEQVEHAKQWCISHFPNKFRSDVGTCTKRIKKLTDHGSYSLLYRC